MSPPTIEPPFQGSDLRDRMANERTLLAWVRTAIALMAFGIGIAKFSLFLELAGLERPAAVALLPAPWISRGVGALLIACGGLVAGLGLKRTLTYAEIIDPHHRPPTHHALTLTAFAVIVMGVVLILELVVA
jgi:putative membrane protein